MSFWKCNRCKGELKTGKEKLLKTCNNCAREARVAFDQAWEDKNFDAPKKFFFGENEKEKEKFDSVAKNKKMQKKIIKKLKKQGIEEDQFKKIIKE